MKANGTNNGCSRLNTPLAATTTLEDPGTPASWKGPPPGSEASPFTPNSVGQGGGPGSGPYNSTGGPPSNAAFQGPSPFPGGAGSPAGAPPYQGPPPGSATPQYTASPAPSGSSTPGPGPPPNSAGFPPPPNNSGPPYNGPGPSPFGSPSGGPPQFVGRPGSSGPPFVPPGAGNPHFPSHGQPFGGPQYGMPPGSPFGPGHPMTGPIGPGHPAMMGPGGPVERIDQGRREFEERVKGVVEGGVMPVRVAQRPPGGIPLHAGVPVAPSSVTASGPSGRCLGGPAAHPAGSPPLPPSLQSLGGGVSNANINNTNHNSVNVVTSNGNSNGNPVNNGLNSVPGSNLVRPNSNAGGLVVNTTSGATNPLQAMASAAASLTQLNNMANGPLPPLAATGPTGPPNLPPPQPATTPTHGGPPTPHGGVTGGPHLNGASPSPHPMPPHGMMSGSPHAPHPHMGGGGPSPHPHHPGPHMVGSPHHPGPHPMGPTAGMMGPAGMQPQGAPGMCGPGPTGPMGPHTHPQGPGVPGQPHMHNDPFYCSPFGSHYFRSLPVPRRHTPYYGQPDYRLYELNKRLQQRTEESDNLWWDAFATEFFEDDATLTLTFCLEDGPKRYTIGRTLIPRYFRSIFEGGVTELYYNLKHPKESFHNTSITLDCDHCVMVTHHGKPMFTKVCTEGRLILEFTFDDLMRIKSWHMSVRTHKELVLRTVFGMQQDPTMLEQLSKNITRQGITNSTLNYLRLCVILEPMQELMSRHKAYALSPRDCLKTTLFQKWQRMVAPPESQRPASKRRKRKGSTSGPGNNAPPAPSKKRSPGPNFSLASQDVMVVGEPSLMGGDFGEEDERLITRLENTQYDATNSLDPHSHDTSGGPPPHPHQFHSEPTPGNSWPPDRGPGPPQGGPGSQGVQGGQGGASGGVQGPQDASQQQQDKKSPAVSQ